MSQGRIRCSATGEEYIGDVAETAPPLTPEQAETIRGLLGIAVARRPDLPVGITRAARRAT